MDESTERNIIAEHNSGYTGASVIEMRLKTDGLLIELRNRLRGIITMLHEDEHGNPVLIQERCGEPLMNDKGVHAILFFAQSFVNPSVVQGNFVEQENYEQFILEKQGALLFMLACNQDEWAMVPQNFTMIHHAISGMLDTFLSRLIKNKERESYAATIKTQENMSTSQKKGIFG